MILKKKPSGFALYCLDLVQSCITSGQCQIKRMMSGWIICLNNYTFAIIADNGNGEELFLKADEKTEINFKNLGCKKFSYTVKSKKEKVIRNLNYYCVPIEIMDSSDEMNRFVQMSLMSSMKKNSKSRQSY